MLEVKKIDSRVVVILQNERIDASNAPQLKKELIKLCIDGNDRIAVNFDHVDFMDSSGLAALLSCVKTLEGKGSLVLFGLNDKVYNLFRITKLDQTIFRIVDSEKSALQILE
jgi:anti-sigma B factor antagonist